MTKKGQNVVVQLVHRDTERGFVRILRSKTSQHHRGLPASFSSHLSLDGEFLNITRSNLEKLLLAYRYDLQSL